MTVQPEEMDQVEGTKIIVKSFRFVGNSLLSKGALNQATLPFLNRELGLTGLRQVTAAVGDVYQAKGLLARVYLPRQEISDGVVTLQVVEALLGQVRLDGPPPARVSTEQILAFISAAQPNHETLRIKNLDRALLLIDDLAGVSASGSLIQGAERGETDVLIKLIEEPLLTGEVGLDNTGSRSTGSSRLTLNALLNSPLKRGDVLASNIAHTRGSDYARLAYTFPLGYLGWRAGLQSSTMNYHFDFEAAKFAGTSNTLGMDLQFPILRSRTRNLFTSFALVNKSYKNTVSDVIASRYDLNSASLGLSANGVDKLGGDGSYTANLTLTQGNVHGELTDPSLAGDFAKLQYQVSRQQVLAKSLAFFAKLSGQTAKEGLDSSEKFYLGGASGIRAYPSSEAGGIEGQMLNIELRWRVRSNFALTGFYDWGRVKQTHDNTTDLNSYHLHGTGMSLTWNGPKDVALTATYARRLGDNPNPVNGTDQDGSLIKDRFWVTASLPF